MLQGLRGSTITLAMCLMLIAGADAAHAGQQGLPDGEPLPNGVGASRFDNDTPTTIPDVSTIEIPFPVSGITGVGRVTTSFYLTHAFDGDVTIWLVSPDNTAVLLSDRNGGSNDNYGTSCGTRTTFDDSSGAPITAGAPPYAGTFRPQQPLATFKGKSGAAANGTWKLRIQDSANLDQGVYFCGSIVIVSCDGACESQPTDSLRISDFDGDSKSDVTVFRPSTGQWFSLQSGSGFTQALVSSWGTTGDTPTSGDYDGDGKADFAVYRSSAGRWFIKYSSSNYTTSYQVNWTNILDIPVPGNYDIDLNGKFDLAMFSPSSGVWGARIEPNWVLVTTLGMTGDIPVQGDYDGDGRTDPAVYRPSTAQWLIKTSSSLYASTVTHIFGISTDIPVPGEYDGDGKVDIAVFRPSTATWYVLLSSTNYVSALVKTFGLSTDTPVPGDFDGDGKTDIAVFRPSTGVWWVLKSSTNYTSFVTYTWGLSTDIPILRRP